MNYTFYYIFIPFIISFFVQWFVIKYFHKRTYCIDYGETQKPQCFHSIPTPRGGGIGIFIGFAATAIIATTIQSSNDNKFLFIILSLLPVFFTGLYEDFRNNIKPMKRLFVIGVGALISLLLLDVIIYDIEFLKLPLMIAIPFTIFAFVGVTNAVNIIDGFNGLASGVIIMVFSIFAYVAHIHNDQLVFSLSLMVIASTAGFFVWNFPKGKIFLGDGGAYLLGFQYALVSVLLVKRNPDISPLFPLVIFAYPIMEVLFSIYRKKFKRGGSPFEPDGIHFHMLIYKRLTRNNPMTSVYIWMFVAIFTLFTLPFTSNKLILLIIFIVFGALYVQMYRMLVHFELKDKIGLFLKWARMLKEPKQLSRNEK